MWYSIGIMSETIQKVKALVGAAKEDLRSTTSVPRMVSFGVTAAAVAFHETTGMEYVLANAGAHAYETAGPLLAGGVMGLTSFAVETALSAGMALNLGHFKNTARTLEEQSETTPIDSSGAEESKERETRDSRIIEGISKATVAISLGSPGVLLKEFHDHPEKSRMERFKTGVKTAGALAVVNTAIGTVISGGVSGAEALGVHQAAEVVLPVVESPYLYIGLFALGRALKGVERLKHKRAERKAANNEAA